VVALGDTFLGGEEVHGEHHLWIVINDPAAHGGIAVFVNITSLWEDAEITCILTHGEHPFVRHDSYVRYRSARQAKASDLAKLINSGKLKAQQPGKPALLAKIRAGAKASMMLTTELKALL